MEPELQRESPALAAMRAKLGIGKGRGDAKGAVAKGKGGGKAMPSPGAKGGKGKGKGRSEDARKLPVGVKQWHVESIPAHHLGYTVTLTLTIGP